MNAADRVSMWAVAVGAGFAGLMLGWLVANRITQALLDPGLAPWVALSTAIGVAVTATIVTAQRLLNVMERRSGTH